MTPSEAIAQAKGHHRAGQLQAAEQIYRQILEGDSANAEACYLLGALCRSAGRLDEAVANLQQAVRLKPDHADAQNHLGIALAQQEKFEPAIACFQEALRLSADFADAQKNLRKATADYRSSALATGMPQAPGLVSESPELHNDMGIALVNRGQLDAAVENFRHALRLKPDCAEAHFNLGTVLRRLGRPSQAVLSLEEAVRLKPDYVEAHHNLGNTFQDLARTREAAASYGEALRLKPGFILAHNGLGVALRALGRMDEAVACFRRALELQPDHVEAHNNLGLALQDQGMLDKAVVCYQRALELKPDFAEAHNNLGSAFRAQGKPDEAVACYRRAMELKLDYDEACSNLLFALQCRSTVTLTELAEVHAEYEKRYAAPLQTNWSPHDIVRDGDRPLRLGFVSPDLYRHPVGYFLVRVLENIDRREAKIVCYSDREARDDLTSRIQATATTWRDVVGWSDERLAEQIRADRVDILFDLAGHTAKNRLLVFARKPAPVQVTWAGYVGTTGLRAMDYLLADRHEVPQAAWGFYQERVLHMPDGYVTYDPPGYAPPVSPPPMLKEGYVTFGSFNNPAKITPQVIEVWAAILRRISGAKLMLKYRGLDTPSVTRRFAEMFAAQGVESTRLKLFGRSPHPGLLADYNRIDLALDTFPYGGGLTTCEALWMGVPVITCPGETFASRHSLSHLSNVGLTETIARDLEQYVELAVALAGDLPRLAALRDGLRERVAVSPLCDGKRFAENLIRLLRDVWREWCRGRTDLANVETNRSQTPADAGGTVIEAGIPQMPGGTRPSVSELNRFGIGLARQGKLDQAIASFRQAVQIKPDYAEAHNNLGNALTGLGNDDEAASCYRRALSIKPNFSPALIGLGDALRRQGKLDEAAACCRRVLELEPESAEAHNNLGNVFLDQGKLDEAVVCYRRALEFKPGYAEAYSNLGNGLTRQTNLDAAAASCRQAIALKPDYADAHNNLGVALQAQGKLDEAVASYRRALDGNPHYAQAHNNLGNALKDQGKLEEAVASYRRALERKPDYVGAHSNFLFSLQYRPNANAANLAEVHAEYERRHAAPLRTTWSPHDNVRDVDRPLRFGFLSPDFRCHPVGYFLIRVLENLDRREGEIVCYNDRVARDELTSRFEAAATTWRGVVGWSDQRLAEQIRADRVDILFDLAGHTANNRLLVFARKPAPIQVTWAGYVGTTGLQAMDCLLADRHEIPQGADRYCQERVLRMPDGYVTYDPPGYAPPVSPPPVLKEGYMTFGSFNNPAKITPQVIKVWATILRRVPGAKLTLKYKGLDTPSVMERLTELFAAQSVESSRLRLLGSSPHPELLAEYNRVDLALDTFPYSGGLTTCEALWMGVPVITCPGETFASRHSLSHLSNVGLTETIARNLEQYVELAVALAGDLPRLAALRAGLRERVAASPLCDGKRFAENLTRCLRGVWRKWCRGQPDCAAPQTKAGKALADDKIAATAGDVPQTRRIAPESATELNRLGIALAHQGKLDEAIASFRRAIQIEPGNAWTHICLGNAFKLQGKPHDAEAYYRRALELKPEYVEAQYNLGIVLRDQGKLDEAVAACRRVLDLKPDYADAHNNLGSAFRGQGKLDEAVACLRRALELKPDFAEAYSNLLFALQCRSKVTLAELAEAHAEYELRYAAPLRAVWKPHQIVCNPERHLRFGFLSPDFGRHPVGYFLIRVLEHINRREAEIVCYSDRVAVDDLTSRIQATATTWREVFGWTDQRLAEQIRADRVDILFDLAGHTANNRLLVFARKPAPIQVTWAGYVGTTGLKAMDYLLADHYEIPQTAERYYQERILRMPDGYVTYDPPEYAPPVSPPPVLNESYVTFGSFNNPAKITPQVIEVWAAILRRVPRAKLMLKYRGLTTPSVTSRLTELFAARGIEASRLKLLGWSPHPELLAEYAHVDLALDTFPYSGGLTTCEALWMGVPVITCAGETFASRHSLSHLSNVGLTETIASDLEQYVELAVALAGDPSRLAKLRAGLRERVAASPLCDGKRFAANLMRVVSDVWREWCRGKTISSVVSDNLIGREVIVAAPVANGTSMGTIPETLEFAIQHHQAGRLQAAEQIYRQILAVQPNQPDACHLLGVVSAQLGKHKVGVEYIRRALALRPNWAEAHNNLGNALREWGQPGEAVVCCQRAVQLKPDYAEAYDNLGLALQAQGKPDEAVASYGRALELKPGYAEAHYNLGNIFLSRGKLDEAVASYLRALELKPGHAQAHNNLGTALKDLGTPDEAVASFRRAVELKPDFAEAYSNLLFALQCRSTVTLAELAETHAEYERRHAAPLRAAWKPHQNVCNPERQLRFGFLSPDLYRHPVGYFLVRALEDFDRREGEIVCYSDRVARDDLTSRIQAAATTWREVAGWSDQRLAEQIRSDRVDILFDLAGHTAKNRLLVFARKPAPVQITWAGYVGTTGLKAMDYLLADRHEVPQAAEGFYQERVLCMPDGYVTFDPPGYAPPVSPPPVLKEGYVTFGSFNNPAKITPQVIEVWAAILRRVPGAKLMLMYRGQDTPSSRRRFAEMFAAQCIESSRLKLFGRSPHPELLAGYNRVDLALDPFPYSGGLTTCEALWMGVPVITCPGETFASRHSLSHLSNVGLTETIAGDLDQYVELAVALAGDLPRLAALRAGLRERVAVSPLCDARRFAANLKRILRDAWREWCRGKTDLADP